MYTICVDPYLALVPGDSNSAQCRMDERHASCHHCDSQNSLRAGNLLKNQLVSLFKKGEAHSAIPQVIGGSSLEAPVVSFSDLDRCFELPPFCLRDAFHCQSMVYP
jgi:hypothetical protein